jgi:hypothetical protein
MVSSLTLYKLLCQMLRDRQIGWIFWDANKSMCKFMRPSLVVMAERASLKKAGRGNSRHLHCNVQVKDMHLMVGHF